MQRCKGFGILLTLYPTVEVFASLEKSIGWEGTNFALGLDRRRACDLQNTELVVIAHFDTKIVTSN
jgi:hypothetical protein